MSEAAPPPTRTLSRRQTWILILSLVFVSLAWIVIDQRRQVAAERPYHELAVVPASLQALALVEDVTLDLPPVLGQDRVMFVGRLGDTEETALMALDVNDGAVQWQWDEKTLTVPNGWPETWPWSPPFAWRWSGLAAADGAVYAVHAYVLATAVHAYDIQTGELQWKRHLGQLNGSDADSFLLAEERLGIRVSEGDFNAFYWLNRENGYLLQQQQEDARYIFWLDEEPYRLYEASTDTVNVSQLAPWRRTVGGCGLIPQVVESALVVQALGCEATPAQVWVLDRQSGAVLWAYEQGVMSNVAVNGRVTAFLSTSGQLLLIDTFTGQSIAALTFQHSSTTIAPDSQFFVGVQEDLLAVYFGDSGQLFLFRLL
ncbi:MAG: PQQ-binding-like beta-propeller repeat protein [Chloroflexota bacterium]